MLLHEIKHAELGASKRQFDSITEEERVCDAFAISFLLDGVPKYAATVGKDEAAVRDQRAMGIMTGLSLIAVLGHESDGTHPPARDRFKLLFDEVGTRPVRWFWLYAATLLMGALEARAKSFALDNFTLDHAGLNSLATKL